MSKEKNRLPDEMLRPAAELTPEQRDTALAFHVERLLRFGRRHKLVKELDQIVARNELLDLLDAPRRVGLTASASHILLPRKSVTAILGISRRPVAQGARSCVSCPARAGCQYQKAGGHCGL